MTVWGVEFCKSLNGLSGLPFRDFADCGISADFDQSPGDFF
jgi:hypothetical protein